MGAAACTPFYACSNTVPGTGLELVIDSTLTSDQFDSIGLEIQQGVDGGWATALIHGSFNVPSPYPLPTSFGIQSGTSQDEIVLINVTALKNNVPVVVRQIQVQVPNDRLAELTVLLSETCFNQICSPTQLVSCQPATGSCEQTAVIKSHSLPSFNVEAGLGSYVDAAGPTGDGGRRDGASSGSGTGSGTGSSSGSGSGGSHSGSGTGSPPRDGGSGHDSGMDGGRDSGVDSGQDSGMGSDQDGGGDAGGCPAGSHCMGGSCVGDTSQIRVQHSRCQA